MQGFPGAAAGQDLPGGMEGRVGVGIGGPYGIGGSTAVDRARKPAHARGIAGFTVNDGTAEAVAAGSTVGTLSLLGLQEAGQDADRDRDARQHGESVLQALTDLQRALLDGQGGEGLQHLVATLRRAPAAADPGLAAIQRAVLQRAAVELARRGIAASV